MEKSGNPETIRCQQIEKMTEKKELQKRSNAVNRKMTGTKKNEDLELKKSF